MNVVILRIVLIQRELKEINDLIFYNGVDVILLYARKEVDQVDRKTFGTVG